jgi:hypothetical protein
MVERSAAMVDPHRVDRYRIYLRGELAKLRHSGDAREFLDRGHCELAEVGLPTTVAGLAGSFATQRMVDEFVEGLADHATIDLTKCCDRWRDNGISAKLAALAQTRFMRFPVRGILLRDAEPCLIPLFAKHEYRLADIATDPDLLARDPYRNFWVGRPVEFDICLAEPAEIGRVKLIDGVHRAIQMFRNGLREIPVCIVSG